MAPKISPLAPERFPAIPPIAGVRVATGACGVRYRARTDVLLVELASGTTVAGALTRSLTASAPVDWCRKTLPGGAARGLVVNSGNANVFTGRIGVQAVEKTVQAATDSIGCRPDQVFIASTGVIGEPLAAEKIVAALPPLAKALAPGAWEDAARAIMTTDTFPKGAVRTAVIGGATVSMAGIAKGSGMIAPDMATMLAFIFTDAAISAPALQAMVGPMVNRTFNCITVDSDTSTSDTVLVFATGAGAKHPAATNADDPLLADFKAKLEELMLDLAHQIVRDGEGASKFVTITVTGAENDRAARRIALSIANSPLVKTAIAGGDANWGRVVMAVGKAGERADRDKLSIRMGGVQIAKDGNLVLGYDETPVVEHMRGTNVVIEADVGIGTGRATVWTCDLTHGYIDVNVDYRS